MEHKIEEALELAAKAHLNQVRKGTDTPYITHPYMLGMMLMEAGCSEDQIIAGILHDTVEDTWVTLEYIGEHFGEKVADIVAGCTEPDKKLCWEKRKQHTIEYLRTAPREICMVACVDKLHNAWTMLREYEKVGDAVWDRFSRGYEDQKWYYHNLVESLGVQFGKGEKVECYEAFKKIVETLFAR